jgi:transposase
MTDSRYPYTYACDFIRNLGPVDNSGVVLSRSDASQIRSGIARALGIDDKELAEKLADAQLANEDDPVVIGQQVQRLMTALGRSWQAPQAKITND